MKPPISYIDIRFSVHATENPERVLKAVANLLPRDHMIKVAFKRKEVKGHYNNPIGIFETRVKDKELIDLLTKKLSKSLSMLDKETLFRNSNLFIEKTNLFIRLDKQAAFKGIIRLRRDDPIHIRIHFQKRNVVETCQKLGLMSL